METNIKKQEFNYSSLSADQMKDIECCETEINDLLSLTHWKIGRILLKAKKSIGHGMFTEWHKHRYPWSERTVRNMMNIARHFISAPDADLITQGAQNLLSAPSVPEEVKNIIQERVKQKISTNKQDAEKIIQLTKENQSLQAKVKVLENSPKIIERVIEKVVEKAPDDLEQREKEIKKKDRQATKILRTVSSLENEKKRLSQSNRDLSDENWKLEEKIKKLEARETFSSPSTIDAANAKKLSRTLKEFREWTIPDIMSDVRLAGGQMQETRHVITEMIEVWSGVLKELDGHSVIDVAMHTE